MRDPYVNIGIVYECEFTESTTTLSPNAFNILEFVQSLQLLFGASMKAARMEQA